VGAAEHHAGVDVLGRGEPGFHHPDPGQQVGDQQGVDDEAGAVLRADHLLAQNRGGERVGPLGGALIGEQGGDELDEFEDGNGVEEVLLVLPIGGADMPTVISLLNSYAGMSATAMGFVLDNKAVIIAGSLDGASGFLLSVIMCRR